VIRLQWTVADVVVKLRERRGWDRERLANEAGVSYATITRLEQGREMKAWSIRKVASAFGLNEAALYALIPAETAPVVDVERQERDALWAKLSEASQRVALANLRRQAELAQAAPGHSRTPAPHAEIPGRATDTNRRKR
jgi:transcriptional regulator with XRE-family HTH domain